MALLQLVAARANTFSGASILRTGGVSGKLFKAVGANIINSVTRAPRFGRAC